MGSPPEEKKAELDKDGISYDFDKAQIDKEGVSLSDEDELDASPADDAPSEALEETRLPRSNRRVIVLSVAAGITVVFLAAVTALFFFHEESAPQKAPIVQAKPSPPPGFDSPEGDIVLDPFMVLYESGNPKESGVLLATLSLQVSPDTYYTLGSRMYDIRTLIHERLAVNAEVYSKDELVAMIQEDLRDFNVREVQFVQFEKR